MATAEALNQVALMVTDLHKQTVVQDVPPAQPVFENTTAVTEEMKRLKKKLKEMRDAETKRKAADKRMAKAANQIKELDKVRRALVNANPVVKKRMKERKRNLKKEIRETIKKVFPVVGETAEMKILKDSVGHEDAE